jgi:hypothetical protein
MRCPRCESEAEGRFCGNCGAALQDRRCAECEAPVRPGNRFCNQCGAEQGAAVDGGMERAGPAARPPAAQAVPVTTAGGAPRPGPAHPSAAAPPTAGPPSPPAELEPSEDRTRWWIAGGAVALAILFLAVPYVWTSWAEGGNGERVPMGAQGAAPGLGPAPNVDLSSMTPREAADRLFNRVMGAIGDGNEAEVASFLPMAVDAYRLVPNLDADGRFHLSLLQHAGGDYAGALETSEGALESQPDHLLNRYAAAEAARELGNVELAAEHFEHLLEIFDEESVRVLPEYREHATFLPTIRQTAEEFLAGNGP